MSKIMLLVFGSILFLGCAAERTALTQPMPNIANFCMKRRSLDALDSRVFISTRYSRSTHPISKDDFACDPESFFKETINKPRRNTNDASAGEILVLIAGVADTISQVQCRLSGEGDRLAVSISVDNHTSMDMEPQPVDIYVLLKGWERPDVPLAIWGTLDGKEEPVKNYDCKIE